MIKIAVIQFPGLNCEYEVRREVGRAGMRGEFFRFNDHPEKLRNFDGFIIPGGFSYEDRGRAGIIASLDPIMEGIKKEALSGKPVLGICNGAQILLEAGLIPGAEGERLSMALARNERIVRAKASAANDEILGTGYYNAWVNIKCTVPNVRTAFTNQFAEGEIIAAPVAHGEGRFTTTFPDLMPRLIKNRQMVFRYSDPHGVILSEFPINPNGALFNIAALCNPEGNVMSIMPHLERSLSSQKLFTGIREYIKKPTPYSQFTRIKVPLVESMPEERYQPNEKSLEFFVDLFITDNEADTFQTTLRGLGFLNVEIQRQTHYEVTIGKRTDLQKLARQLILSGVLLNTNKERAVVRFRKSMALFDSGKFVPHPGFPVNSEKPFIFLVREKKDFIGMSKTAVIQKRLGLPEVVQVKRSTLWKIFLPIKNQKEREKQIRKMFQTNIFSNPHSQESLRYEL